MNANMQQLFNLIKTQIEFVYQKELPTRDQILTEAQNLRRALSLSEICIVSDEEYQNICKILPEHILHRVGCAETLKTRDSEHAAGWYLSLEHGEFYWKRYREYLKNKWSPAVVDRLHQTTTDIMDNLGDPNSEQPFQRRGLLLGEVQSGKTATYTAICNKAVDSGYKVVIVLAGIMENLRIQTQERLDREFVGIDSKYALDKKVELRERMVNEKVGVGKTQCPEEKEIPITTFTSVTTDFRSAILKALNLNLNNLKGAALFVIKKNSRVLNNLYKWLTKDEPVLNLPLLLIDDEADNASVNTSAGEKERTAINGAINKILRAFKQASYLGITATPFANIFITPELEEDEAAKDLFPRDFLTLLPTPERYIGVDQIFGRGDVDNWYGTGNTHDPKDTREYGEFWEAIESIGNKEQEKFFRYGHKSDLKDELASLPNSLCDAVRYFVLVTAISDLRFDRNEHRSMLVNVSRFSDVQDKVAELLSDFIGTVSSAIEGYSQLPIDQAMKITELAELKRIWDKYNLTSLADISWETVLKDNLTIAARRIKVKAVNQHSGPGTLDYHAYKETGMRVIAVGGNSLSRGLTLEGLIVSYFYRNTMMYDTLLQMGRWFGYRENYRDLFKIWMGEDTISWYCYITDAYYELKEELRKMARQGATPKEFGLKVRQAPASLIVTARNKMRRGTEIEVPKNLSRRLIETPRFIAESETIQDNNKHCEQVLRELHQIPEVSYEYDSSVNAHIWRNVPKRVIASLVQGYKSHAWNLSYQSAAISEMILTNSSLDTWDLAIPEGSFDSNYVLEFEDGQILKLKAEDRKITRDASVAKMLKVSDHHVRVGSGGCTKIGLSKEVREKIRKKAKEQGEKVNDKSYLIKGRKPIALIHLLHNTNEELHDEYPNLIYAIGLGFPAGEKEIIARYVVNDVLRACIAEEILEDED
mgnify:CR=1 FL=1